jgi:hypothetical protein
VEKKDISPGNARNRGTTIPSPTTIVTVPMQLHNAIASIITKERERLIM